VHLLRRDGFEPDWVRVEDEEGYVEALTRRGLQLVLADYTLPTFGAPRALELLGEHKIDVPLIVVTGSVGEERAVACMRDGAADYLLKDRLARLGLAIRRALAQQESRQAKRVADEEIRRLKRQLELENAYLQAEIKSGHNFDEIIGDSEELRRALDEVEVVAHTDATVLILGETGTGKELFARAIHDRSRRSQRPLVKVNCAALSASLIENELFGHEKGAYTGASDKAIGRFELADGGTLFLDEVGELPAEVQAKLLRVLQEGEFSRIGDPKTVKVDVRIIAATNRDLAIAVEEGRFRADLYYRLNVFPLQVPALRERTGDVELLARWFVRRLARKHDKPIREIPEQALRALAQYHWPGNVRELENVIERAVIMSTGGELELGEIVGRRSEEGSQPGQSLADVESQHIQRVLDETGWRVEGKGGAADVLGLKAGTLRSRMKKLGIRRPS
jgi:transcriptional regulator with GAF, ATPase, and Fis domain